MDGLNEKQLRFVELYQRSVAAGKPNATQAYIAAGYKARGKSAGNAASKLLEHDGIKALLKPVKAEAEIARVEQVTGIVINRERIRLEMARLAFVNPKAFFRPDGTKKAIHELDDDTAAALASFEVEEEVTPGDEGGTITRTTKYKTWDKNKALSNLADTEPGVWVNDRKDQPAGGTNVNVNVTTAVINPLPAPAAVVEFLRDLGIACNLPVLPDGGEQPVDRPEGV